MGNKVAMTLLFSLLLGIINVKLQIMIPVNMQLIPQLVEQQ